jgi:hypothetical protein
VNATISVRDDATIVHLFWPVLLLIDFIISTHSVLLSDFIIATSSITRSRITPIAYIATRVDTAADVLRGYIVLFLCCQYFACFHVNGLSLSVRFNRHIVCDGADFGADAQEGAEGGFRGVAPVEAEDELVEVGLEMLAAQSLWQSSWSAP